MVLPRKFRHISTILLKPEYGFEYYPNSHKKVVSCKEASKERGIGLEEELKSILVKIKGDFYLIHLRGSQRIDSKKILRIFNIPFYKKNSFRFATIEELKTIFNSAPGLVCPFVQKFWSIKHLISKELIDNNHYLFTNDDTFFGHVKFKALLLTKTKNNKIINFIEN